jgi:hypothetical protein
MEIGDILKLKAQIVAMTNSQLTHDVKRLWPIYVLSLSMVVSFSQITDAAFTGLNFADLVHKSELIVLGKVLDKKIIGPGSIGPGLLNHTVSVQKVISGDPVRDSIGVITEPDFYEDSPKMKIGELVILFLNHDKLYGNKPAGNDYAVVNFEQGKYAIRNGLVTGLAADSDTRNMTIFDFEKKVFNAINEPEPINSKNVTIYDYGYANETEYEN